MVLTDEYDQGLSTRKAVYKKYAQAIPGAFAIQKVDKASCRLECPAGINVQGYVQMVGQGKYPEALEIIMEDLPLPGVIGRICPHSCENVCRRREVDEAVAIRDLKRLAADQVDPREIKVKRLPHRKERVAIIGSGPAGLSAAYHLAKKGVLSTIFEALPEPGGMLRVGIPEYRLPREVLEREIEVITNLGVEIKTNTPLGAELTIDALFEQGYRAVYLAIGTHKGIRLGIAGEGAEGVRQGVDFLREVNLTGRAAVGKKLAIIGGGNVAIDVARSAIRLGAEEVNILYRRSRTEMPASEEEIQAAEAEGVEAIYLTAPKEILAHDEKVQGLRCIRMELGEADSSGRRSPVAIPGSEYDMEIDQLIVAIGQRPDLSGLKGALGLGFSRKGTIEVDPITYATGRDGVFAGGDVQTGPWVAIGAIAAGREVAESIVRYLEGRDMAEGRKAVAKENPVYRPIPKDESKEPRARMPELPVAERRVNFKEVALGYDKESGLAEAHRCLNCGYCCECFQCVQACGPGAVTLDTHGQRPEIVEVEVGAIILAPGFRAFDPSDPSRLDTYCYTKHPNIITSMEFERILSASGPTRGRLIRLSDRKEPKKIAWVQCVGSRDINQCDNGYCSSVCCMYAIKEAVIAKEHSKDDLDCAIFFMDMRTHGKGFERYYDEAREKRRVRFIRSRPHTINPVPGSDDLLIRYVSESGDVIEETFSMVVLSVGLETTPEVRELGRKLDIDLTKGQFCQTSSFSPVASSRDGVYVCGAFQGPKDIPDSVMQASAAACVAGSRLARARGTLVREKVRVAERIVAGEPPRVGVFVCNCGVNIGGVVRVPEVAEYAKTLPNVVYAQENLFSCSQDAIERLVEVIKEENLNRVVVASCSPRTHEPLFQETLRNSGLNKYLFEQANIRDQCSWVHANEPDAATEKAKDLVRMAVAKAARLEPLEEVKLEVTQAGLVIGGGLAGMTAALGLADQGFPVHLVEKEKELGGHGQRLLKTWKDEDIGAFTAEVVQRVKEHPFISVHLESTVEEAEGFLGNFRSTIKCGEKTEVVEHGAVIIAIGASELRPSEYHFGRHPNIFVSMDLDQAIASDPGRFKDVRAAVFIQCVGSRETQRPYCSKVCCTHSIQSALRLKELNPEMNICILFRDIRTYGEREGIYREARSKGILFFRYSLEAKPKVDIVDDNLRVTLKDQVLQAPVQIDADIITLASAVVPPADGKSVSRVYKLAMDEEGFFQEAHAKLRPVDFATDGVYMAGLAHGPKPVEESIAQAQAAAARAICLLAAKTIYTSAVVAYSEAAFCSGCGVCAEICPFGAASLDAKTGKAQINPAECKGCGLCVASCRSGALNLKGFDQAQTFAMIDEALC